MVIIAQMCNGYVGVLRSVDDNHDSLSVIGTRYMCLRCNCATYPHNGRFRRGLPHQFFPPVIARNCGERSPVSGRERGFSRKASKQSQMVLKGT